jgi:hypothetical protein
MRSGDYSVTFAVSGDPRSGLGSQPVAGSVVGIVIGTGSDVDARVAIVDRVEGGLAPWLCFAK